MVRPITTESRLQEPLPGLPDNHIDGSTELWFDDLAGIAGVFQSPNYMATIRSDEEKFSDLQACEFLIGMKNQVIPATNE
jgi:hypothetical protein